VVAWLKNSLIIVVFMTETSDALNQQTERLQTKEIEGQTVVLGKGFEESYVSPYINDKEAMDVIKQEYQESKYGMNKVDYNDIVVEDLSNDRDGFISYMKERVQSLLGYEKEKEKQIIEARPGQQFDKDNVPTGDVKVEKVETPIVPKEKTDEIKFMYDADLIAKMIVTEAGDKNLNEEEMLAMANVVVNRANKKTGFSIGKGETRIEKLIRSGDFLGVTEFEDRFNNPRKTHEEKYIKAFNIARDLLAGKLKDNTGGALYFNQDPMSNGKKYGEHYFYIDPYKAR